jgi:alcohol dehydrogenase class IV
MLTAPLRLSVPLPRLLGPGQVIAGEGALSALRSLPAVRVAIIATDRASAVPALSALLTANLPYETRRLRPSWQGEPTLPTLAGTLAELIEYNPDWIVAVGGGSVIDGAKLCWARLEHPHFPLDRLSRPFALPRLRAAARFAAVPTTAGTGSEASSSAVYTDEGSGRKVPVVSHEFLPDVVVLDPRLTMGLPDRWTVLTALDALGHALEGYVSRLANPLVDGLAESAVAAILAGVPELLTEAESLERRLKLQIAAFQAGQVQNHRVVGLAHLIAHQLGALDVPHALAVATYLPASMSWASRDPGVRGRYARIAGYCGLADEKELIAAVKALPARADMSGAIAESPGVPAVLSQTDASAIARRALDDPIARFLPVPIEEGELAAIVRQGWTT